MNLIVCFTIGYINHFPLPCHWHLWYRWMCFAVCFNSITFLLHRSTVLLPRKSSPLDDQHSVVHRFKLWALSCNMSVNWGGSESGCPPLPNQTPEAKKRKSQSIILTENRLRGNIFRVLWGDSPLDAATQRCLRRKSREGEGRGRINAA